MGRILVTISSPEAGSQQAQNYKNKKLCTRVDDSLKRDTVDGLLGK